MAKYNSKSVYGTLFTMLDNLSEENQDYLMENVFDDDFNDVLHEYEPILLLIMIDLKEEIIYASVDLGNGVAEDVARERLADNEKDFRKQIQRMIDAF